MCEGCLQATAWGSMEVENGEAAPIAAVDVSEIPSVRKHVQAMRRAQIEIG